MTKTEKPDLLQYENELVNKGYKLIAGVDEVGRGPLAGPVCVACVIMDLENIVEGVNDSKKLSEKKREKLYPLILERAISYNICLVDPKTIDEINILNATKLAMKRAVEGLEITPDIVLIDAVKLDLNVETMPIIHGDALSYSIGCASIVAKVYRDHLMNEYAKEYPQYGFDRNKGYGTKEHIQALKEFGKTPIHRESFITHFEVKK